MQAIKQEIYDLVENMPSSQLAEIISFITFVKMRDGDKLYKGLEALSVTSTDFWDNAVDDEVWNNV